jgi:hypothetical protein
MVRNRLLRELERRRLSYVFKSLIISDLRNGGGVKDSNPGSFRNLLNQRDNSESPLLARFL